MATPFISLFFAFIISVSVLLLSADGTRLQKNSIEVKAVSHATDYNGKTNYSDVLGMAQLVNQYSWLSEANNDPCIPPIWSWIECNSDAQPRVVALNLANELLFGSLPDFSSMDALTRIDLQLNSLFEVIPSFLGEFPHLQELNLSYNLFYGQVPDSIACNKNLTVSLDGNSDLYTSNSCSSTTTNTSPSSEATPTTPGITTPDSTSGDGFDNPTTYSPTTYSRTRSKTPVIFGSAGSIFFLFWIAGGIFAIFRHKAKTSAAVAAATSTLGTNANMPVEEMPINSRPPMISP